MTTLEQITPSNALVFKAVRLAALQDSPSAFGGTFAKESQLNDVDWLKRAAVWSNDRSVGYIVMDAGNACGIAAAFLDERDSLKAHLISMWVAPAYRRRGIGRLLIEAINTWACTRGAHMLQLMVTNNDNTAIEFYKRCGFSMTGNTEPYPNDPTLIEYEMSRLIKASS
ncbi:MAG TPA: GNAT family N-acetyltransferase [Phycisphaerae bacterium]|nr:GNAT family N-acetyltransferase [Phycisphaerae bacterium]